MHDTIINGIRIGGPMELLTVVLIAVGLAMDAFAVSLCKGLAMGKPTIKQMLIVGLWFGVFQALMPVIGFYLGSSFYSYITDFDHWIAAGLLWLIGLNMIRESLSSEDEEMDASLDMCTMLVLAIATSIDALAVGISLAMGGGDILVPAVLIGVITLAISAAGVYLGGLFGDRFGRKAEFVGGLILVIIGIRILAEHMGWF